MNQVPFPGKMFYDIGESFVTGCSLGSAWYFLKGAYFAMPRQRIKGGLHLLRAKATGLGGSFASWSFVYSMSYTTSQFLRKRDDPFNSIIAGFSTGFILSIRSGFKSAIKSGVTGCLVLSAIESIVMISQQYSRKMQIVQSNDIIQLYKREYEKKGIRMLPNQNNRNMSYDDKKI